MIRDLAWIRDRYGVPAQQGGHVTYTGDADGQPRVGTIVGVSGGFLRVRFPGAVYPQTIHPTFAVAYGCDVHDVVACEICAATGDGPDVPLFDMPDMEARP